MTLGDAVRLARFPSAEALVSFLMAGRLADAVSTLGDDARQALLDEACRALALWGGPDGLAFPMESHLLTARR